MWSPLLIAGCAALALASGQARAAPDCSVNAERVDALCYPDLQTAVNAAIASDRPLYLPKMTFTVSQTVTIDFSKTADTGFQLISDGAAIDGNGVTAGPVLQVQCSGGTRANPKGCFYFHEIGTLFVNGHNGTWSFVLGQWDYSDAQNSAKLDHLIVNNGGVGGAVYLNYVLRLEGNITADTGGQFGLVLGQVQMSNLTGGGSAAGGWAVWVSGDYNLGVTFNAPDWEASPGCLLIPGGNTRNITVTGGMFNCGYAVYDPLKQATVSGAVYGGDVKTGIKQ